MIEKKLSLVPPAVDNMWNAFRKSFEWYKKQDHNLVFHEDKYEIFKNTFFDLYKTILTMHMKPDVVELDRHKVAAVTIVSCIQSEVISYKNGALPNEKYFLGPEMIATEVALSWMLRGLNQKLQVLFYQTPIKQYTMPTAFACPTPYFDIFCRNLYYARTSYMLNPLDVSEKLFLLEYITLLTNGIDPEYLCFKKPEETNNFN